MAVLLTDSNGIPVPQYLNLGGTAYEVSKGKDGGFFVSLVNPVIAIGTKEAVAVCLLNSVDGSPLPATAANGLRVDVSKIDATVDAKISFEPEAVLTAETPVTTTGTPNDTTVFDDISDALGKGVQVYVDTSADLVALIIEAKVGVKYFPLLVVKPIAGADPRALVASLYPSINGFLSYTWRIKVITVTAATPTINAVYQYI
jgi:hypothetical protein